MLKLMIASAWGAAALFTANAAVAESLPLEMEFEQICLPMTVAEDALARAQAAGFVVAPEEERKRAGVPGEGIALLMRKEEGRTVYFVGARHKQLPGGVFRRTLITEMCVLAQSPGMVDSEMGGRVDRMLGVGPYQRVGRASSFLYLQTPEGRVRTTAEPKSINARAAEGSLRMVGVTGDLNTISITLIIPHPEAKAAGK
jgi:hypothetical protein